MRLMTAFVVLVLSPTAIANPAATKNEDGSFKISDQSQKVMGINFARLDGSGPWTLPSNSLVKIKFTQGIYRRYEGNITYVLVSVLKSDSQTITLQSEDLEAGDEVAVNGTNFLRLTESDLNSETVDSCAH